MNRDEMYQRWLERRRQQRPSPEAVDRIVERIERVDEETSAAPMERVGKAAWTDRRLMRVAACLAALAVGSMPFLFLMKLAQVF